MDSISCSTEAFMLPRLLQVATAGAVLLDTLLFAIGCFMLCVMHKVQHVLLGIPQQHKGPCSLQHLTE